MNTALGQNSATDPIGAAPRSRGVLLSLVVLALLVMGLWQFPALWYRDPHPGDDYRWFAEQTRLPGWTYREVPVSTAAESVIQADAMASGVFRGSSGRDVQVYSAKRYLKKENEIGLFSHTPDRCWTAVGWRMEPASPDVVEMTVHGVRLLLERRVFTHGTDRVLVYFGAVVGGKPLPYRLDQYHSASRASGDGTRDDSSSTWRRLAQARLWSWAWDSFRQRTPLSGPQQFIRISTAEAGDLAAADRLLRDMLPLWLQPVDYQQELRQWETRSASARTKP